MNPKLKKVVVYVVAFAAGVGVIFGAVRGVAYVIARALANGLPTSEIAIVSFMLFLGGMFLIDYFDEINKTVKTVGFVIFLTGCLGIFAAIVMGFLSY